MRNPFLYLNLSKLKRLLGVTLLLTSTFITFFVLSLFFLPSQSQGNVSTENDVEKELDAGVITQKKYCDEIRLTNFYFAEEKNKKNIFVIKIGKVTVKENQGDKKSRVAFLKDLEVDFFSGYDSERAQYFSEEFSGFDFYMSNKLTDTLTKQFNTKNIRIEKISIKFHENNYMVSALTGKNGAINEGFCGFLIYNHVNMVRRRGDHLYSEKVLWTPVDDKFHIENGFSLQRGVKTRRGKEVVVDHLLNEVKESLIKAPLYLMG